MKNIIFLILVFSFNSFSQEKVSFYFDSNKSDFNKIQQNEFNQFLNKIKGQKIFFYSLTGMTDVKGENKYNDSLALARILYVHKKLRDSINIKNKIEYEILGEVEGNFKKSRRVELAYKLELPVNKQFNEAKIGDTIRFETLNFIPGKPDLLQYSKPLMNEIADYLVKNKSYKIKLLGHICCELDSGNYIDNNLSYRRCMTVYKFLIDKGVNAYRMKYEAFEGSRPIFKMPEKNEFERIMNRRVEIVIVSK